MKRNRSLWNVIEYVKLIEEGSVEEKEEIDKWRKMQGRKVKRKMQVCFEKISDMKWKEYANLIKKSIEENNYKIEK